MTENHSVSPETWKSCLDTLRQVISTPESAPDLEEIERLSARVYKNARKRRRREAAKELSKNERMCRKECSRQDRIRNQSADKQLVQNTAMARIHQGKHIDNASCEAVSSGAEVSGKTKHCYCCGKGYRKIHFFYHKLCPECAQFNYEKRFQRTDLPGRYALITGGRIKIGFQTALKLLRDGASVMITTRFPKDAAERFAKQDDFHEFSDRLNIQGLDLMYPMNILAFVQNLETFWPWLDILVNNAAQTIWRPPGFYAPALQKEQTDTYALPPYAADTILSFNLEKNNNLLPLSDFKYENLPTDRHGQPFDKREKNSWTVRLHELEVRELLEVLLVNTAAPCLLTARLKPLFMRSPFEKRFVVNVCGLDGQFSRHNKTDKHPHVNMSKAGLNMMTRTAAADYVQDGIYMNSVDTGWITHEGAYSGRKKMEAKGFVPPLDETDGASRIYDTIVQGILANPSYGKLFRNYQLSDW